jgi:hypothetical protein
MAARLPRALMRDWQYNPEADRTSRTPIGQQEADRPASRTGGRPWFHA